MISLISERSLKIPISPRVKVALIHRVSVASIDKLLTKFRINYSFLKRIRNHE